MYKRLLLLCTCVLVINIGLAQTQSPVYLSTAIASGSVKGYYEYLPPNYATSGLNYPLIIWVHGAGQIGSGNAADLPKVLQYGVPKLINDGAFPSTFTVNGSTFSFIIISPQFNSWAYATQLDGVLTYVLGKYRVDPNRIYFMGISMGGGAVWDYASKSIANSNKLAAIVPFSGTLAPTQANANRIAASNLPVWAFHNTNDGIVPVAYSRNWVSYINSYTPHPSPAARLTENSLISNDADTQHDSWTPTTPVTWTQGGLNIYQWMLQYTRRIPVANALPQANAGADVGLLLPNNLSLSGSASNDPDGVIVGYKWHKVSGPSSYSFVDSTVVNPTITNLAAGTYIFELAVTDNLGGVGKDSVTAYVYPTVDPNSQQRILIDVGAPTASSGVLTTSPDINGNVWNNMLDGRPGVQITNALTTGNIPSGISLEVVNRIDGTSAVTPTGMMGGNTIGPVGDYPASATNDYAFAHNSATNGLWRIKGMDPNKVYRIKFWGAKSGSPYRDIEIKRADETTWQTYSATNNTNYNNACVFNMTGVTQMDFNIRVKSTSTWSHLNVIDITFSGPSNPVNQPPVAKAGNDTTIRLPQDTIVLSGCTSYDPENAAIKYKWRKIAGPASYSMPVDTLCNLTVRSLAVGTYSFELAVTDTAGLVGKDTVSVIVNNLLPTPWPTGITPLCNQPFKIVVVGSSTAFGLGANPIDSSWVNKFRMFAQSLNPSNQVINLGIVSFTTYHVCPSNYTPPAGRPLPDTLHNITKALSYNPDAIIVNLPSNDIANGFTLQETEDNFDRIVAAATARNIPIWVSTTQPRDNLNTSERASQVTLRDWINQRYGNFAIDFWTTVANADATINSTYSANDGVHVNNYGHHIFFTRVIAENIWDTICIRRNLSPIARAGNDTAVVGTNISFPLNGTASSDPEGSVLTYSWRVTNSANASITNSTSSQPTFSTTISGTYSVELKVTDNYGKTGLDTMIVSVGAPNQPPNANAGTDKVISLPTNTVTLNGSASNDPDGTITYKWLQVQGPNTATTSNDAVANPVFNNLIAGTYLFELTVTDDSLATDADTVFVFVNQPPVANAGADAGITLPTNSTTLDGTLSFDADGTITYAWTKISGGAATIVSGSSATTNVTGLVQGTYQFELKVTDNNGATGKDTVVITVNPDPNIPPVARAGNDQSIQLPMNKVFLDGRTSTDANGSITGYLWTYVSGPAGYSILTATKDTTSVTFSSAGTYTFRLTVTDNGGLTGTDDVIVTVQAALATTKAVRVNVYDGTVPFNNTQWNNWNTTANLTSSNFLYEDGTNSTVNAVLSTQARVVDNGTNYVPNAVSCPPAVLRFNSLNTSDRTLTIRGLNTTKQYHLEFYASRNVTGNSTICKIGTLSDTISTDNNANDYAKFDNITPNSSGQIVVTFVRIGTYNYLAGFIVVEPNATPRNAAPPIAFVPVVNEPTSRTVAGNGLSVSPNPFSDIINIQLGNKETGSYQLFLRNMSGKIVWFKKGILNNSVISTSANTSGLQKGIYFLQLITDWSNTTMKLMKE